MAIGESFSRVALPHKMLNHYHKDKFNEQTKHKQSAT